jgi:hypothetical protein
LELEGESAKGGEDIVLVSKFRRIWSSGPVLLALASSAASADEASTQTEVVVVTARTVEQQSPWEVKVTPYYIGVDKLGDFTPLLKFDNHTAPLNADIGIDYAAGPLTAGAKVQGVAEKSQVDTLRNEPEMPAYALLNLRASYTWREFRFDAGIDNVLDTAYSLPLGGVALSDYFATGILRPLPGMGRSDNVSVTANL